MKNLFGVLRYVRGYWRYGIANIVFNVLHVIFSLFSITMVIPFLNLLFLSDSARYQEIMTKGAPHLTFNINSAIDYFNYSLSSLIVNEGKGAALIYICIIVLVLMFFKNLFRYLAMFFLAPIRNGVVKDFRNSIYNKSLELPLSYYTEERKGDIISKMTTDVQEVEWSIMSSLEMIFRDPVNILLFLITLIFISPQLTLFVFILLPLSGLLIALIGKSLKRKSGKAKESLGLLFSIMEETLGGLRIIKAFNAEKFVRNKFEQENDIYTKLTISTYRRVDLASPMSEFMGAIALVVLIYFGGHLVLDPGQELEAAEFIGYIAIFSQLIPPAKSLTSAYYNVQKGMASIERINKVLHAEVTIVETPHARKLETFNREIEYRNLSFAYTRGDKGYVLKNIDLKIPKGKTIALVGQSGSGKSTLADLLPRFYDPSEGGIFIDGTDIRSYRIPDLRSLMGIVSQEAILFNDTIFNNIAFGMPQATEAEVMEAARIANAHDFIVQTENKYQTNIGDRGSKLSGGQRQRLSIARAVLKNPPILILDEATSALDTESERLVQDALNKLMQNRTTIVIAHRLSTIQHADEIVVLHQGQIIERGTHSELLKLSGTYRRLYELQAFA